MAPIESFSLRCVVITFSLNTKYVITTKLTCYKGLSIGQIFKIMLLVRAAKRHKKPPRRAA
jgi:hypothetical protein